jgi:CheY-like chemotaxis protein
MDGYEATREIRNLETTDVTASKFQVSNFKFRTIIIALTASVFEEEREVALSVGFDDFLRKPFHEIELFNLMSKHLDVRFVYAEDKNTIIKEKQPSQKEDVLTPTAISKLPGELQTALRQAAVELNFDATRAIIEQIRPQNELLAEALRELTNRYRFDKIEELFGE